MADKIYDYEIFACLEADASQREIFAPTETDGTLEYVRENALIWREPSGDRLLALSTCKFPQTSERVIVFGVLKGGRRLPGGSGIGIRSWQKYNSADPLYGEYLSWHGYDDVADRHASVRAGGTRKR